MKDPINLESQDEWEDMKKSYGELLRNPKRSTAIEIELIPQQGVRTIHSLKNTC
jgi:hypothetical protein